MKKVTVGSIQTIIYLLTIRSSLSFTFIRRCEVTSVGETA